MPCYLADESVWGHTTTFLASLSCLATGKTEDLQLQTEKEKDTYFTEFMDEYLSYNRCYLKLDEATGFYSLNIFCTLLV